MRKGKSIFLVINYIIMGFVLVILTGCKDDSEETQENISKKLVLLKVDYQTHDFEGGQLIELPSHTNLADTIPLIVNHIAPLDFGSLSIYYNTTSATSLVFDGSIVWMGLGSRTFPTAIVNAIEFPVIATPLADIDSADFHVVYYDLEPQPIYYDSIWDGIKNLRITEYIRSVSSRKMSLFLYRPSDGAGDPADWDWYIIMEE